MADPYLEPQDVRDRISTGGTALAESEYDNDWIADTVEEWEHTLEDHTGDAYVEREGTWTGGVPSPTCRIITPWVHITEIVSVTVDGDEVDVQPDAKQPYLSAGMIDLVSPVRCGQTVTVVAKRCNPDERCLRVAQRTCVMYVEQMATLDRAASTPDASRVFNEYGGSTVYVTPDPDATPPRLTGYREIDRKVNTLIRYNPPGIA